MERNVSKSIFPCLTTSNQLLLQFNAFYIINVYCCYSFLFLSWISPSLSLSQTHTHIHTENAQIQLKIVKNCATHTPSQFKELMVSSIFIFSENVNPLDFKHTVFQLWISESLSMHSREAIFIIKIKVHVFNLEPTVIIGILKIENFFQRIKTL